MTHLRSTSFVLSALLLITLPAIAGGRGARSYSSHTRTSTTGRTYYGGGKHTESHGGNYSYSNSGSSHKGGRYTSPTGSHQYGRHK
jgi:hypothetical protein